MSIAPQGIAWIVTYACNLRCRHCFFDTHPGGDVLRPDTVRWALASLRRPEDLRWQHLTGGEPMLSLDDVGDILSTFREFARWDIGIATNGFWADSEATASRVVSRLKNGGVTGVCLSADAFHQPAVPVENIRRAVLAVAEAGLTGHSFVVSCRLAADSPEADKINSETDRVLAQLGPVPLPLAPTTLRYLGRGRARGSAQEGIPDGPCRDLSCCLGACGPFEPQMVWIDPAGRVMICYGLVIGSIQERTLQEILDAYRPDGHPVLERLAGRGPIALYELAKEKGWRPSRGFADECDLCYASRAFLREVFPAILAPDECYPRVPLCSDA